MVNDPLAQQEREARGQFPAVGLGLTFIDNLNTESKIMKLEKLAGRVPGFTFAPGGSYLRVHVGEVAFYFRRRPGERHWIAFRDDGGGPLEQLGFRHRTLKEAKAFATREWIKATVDDLYQAVRRHLSLPDVRLLLEMCVATAEGGDLAAPSACKDWLEERGLDGELENRVIQPGRDAGVEWPDGWQVVVGQ